MKEGNALCITSCYVGMPLPVCIHPDFQTWLDGYDSTCHDSTLITWRIASQYVNGCQNNWEFCRGIRNSERKSGWQGKLNTKGHTCNEARIPTNAFYLKRKALLPGKRRHDTEIMITCDTLSSIAEFECNFCRPFHNGHQYGKKRNSPMVYRLVFFRMTRFRYFAVGEYHPQFSDANLVNREANVYCQRVCPQ